MAKVVVVGGGAAGCGAAVAAAKAGADVTLLERTDMLFGAATRAGRFNFNGEFVGTTEWKALGGGEILDALESIVLHRGNIVNEEHTMIYNTVIAEPTVKSVVEKQQVKIHLEARVVGVVKESDSIIKKVILADGSEIEGDAFVDATGSSGGVSICNKYGKGCVMCIYYRCPLFGDRVSIATKAGARSFYLSRPDGTPGRLGAAVGLYKGSLSSEIREKLQKNGTMSIPLPKELIDYNKLKLIGATRTREQMEQINLVDIGATAKCVGLVYFPLENFRKLPGFERAVIEDPLGGGKFNKIGNIDICLTDSSTKVEGFRNLFASGDKAGLSGVVHSIMIGYLSGNNAARAAAGKDPLILPRTLVMGDFIQTAAEVMARDNAPIQGHVLGHGVFFEKMKKNGFYPQTPEEVRQRVEKEGLAGILSQKVC